MADGWRTIDLIRGAGQQLGQGLAQIGDAASRRRELDLKEDAFNNLILRDFFKNEESNQGVGYYPDSLIGGTK